MGWFVWCIVCMVGSFGWPVWGLGTLCFMIGSLARA
jgi:hypothetical protein